MIHGAATRTLHVSGLLSQGDDMGKMSIRDNRLQGKGSSTGRIMGRRFAFLRHVVSMVVNPEILARGERTLDGRS